MASAFANITEDEPDAAWHIDPRDKDLRSEEKRQAAFLRLAKRLCPEVNVFAVPNGARRTAWEAGKAKREGMKSGALDLVVTWNRGAAFIEFKDGAKMPTENQREMLNMLYRQGHHCGVFRQEQSALDWLRSIGAPFIGRLT